MRDKEAFFLSLTADDVTEAVKNADEFFKEIKRIIEEPGP